MHGIDLSPEMVQRLREKPGAERVGVTIGDFATTRVDGTFRLAYLVFNTIMNLTTQDAQVACFCNAAAHLEPGGYFVIEVGVPDLRRLPPGESVRAFTVSPTYVGFDEYTDFVAQTMSSHHYRVVDDKLEVFLRSVPLRVAVRARPDGAHRRDDAARTVERLEPPAVHRREHVARFGVAAGDLTGQSAAPGVSRTFVGVIVMRVL